SGGQSFPYASRSRAGLQKLRCSPPKKTPWNLISPTAVFRSRGLAYFNSPCEGYGPREGKTLTTGIIRYGKNSDGSNLGSLKLTQIRRPSLIWLIGDVGYPKTGLTVDKMPPAY